MRGVLLLFKGQCHDRRGAQSVLSIGTKSIGETAGGCGCREISNKIHSVPTKQFSTHPEIKQFNLTYDKVFQLLAIIKRIAVILRHNHNLKLFGNKCSGTDRTSYIHYCQRKVTAVNATLCAMILLSESCTWKGKKESSSSVFP